MISFSCSFHFIHCFCWIKNKWDKNNSINPCWWCFTITFLSLIFFSSSFNIIPLQIFIGFHSSPTEYLSVYSTYLFMLHFDISIPLNGVSIDWIPSLSFLFWIYFLFFFLKKLWKKIEKQIVRKFTNKNIRKTFFIILCYI